jgi:hypothetical protein
MDTIFAVPLDVIAIFVLGFGLLALAGLAYFAWRNRIPPQ